MRHFPKTALGIALAAMLSRCVHAETQASAPASRVGQPSPASSGALEVAGPSGTMILQTPCRAGDETPDGRLASEQIEVGFTLKRLGNRSPRWQTVPYAGYRCGG